MSLEEELRNLTNQARGRHQETDEERYKQKLQKHAEDCAERFKLVCLNEARKGKLCCQEYASTETGGEFFTGDPNTDFSTLDCPFARIDKTNEDIRSLSVGSNHQLKYQDLNTFIDLMYRELHKLGIPNVTVKPVIQSMTYREPVEERVGGMFSRYSITSYKDVERPTFVCFQIAARW